jgi:antagonist of KipI
LRVRVRKGGLLTTVQDSGRWRYQALGVSVAGPMDLYSHRLANALVGNEEDAASLEVTLAGPDLEFADERRVAVTGAEFEMSIGGRVVPANASVSVSAGERLVFGPRIRGARAYIAFSGGIDTPKVLGSRATHLPSGMGGLQGRALKAGDELPLGPPEGGHSVRRVRLEADQMRAPMVLRVLPGPQRDRFAAGALDALQSAPYRIDAESNRMGYRLAGQRLEHAGDAQVTSDATPLGVLQVPASGQPILLMADRPTTGGYAKLATVISADIRVAGQLAPGDEIRFALCSPREALAALVAQEQILMAVAGRS